MKESPGVSAERFFEEQHGVFGPGLCRRVEASQQRLDPGLPFGVQGHPQQVVEDGRQGAEGVVADFVPVHGGEQVESLIHLTVF